MIRPLFLTSLAPRVRREICGQNTGMVLQEQCYRSVEGRLGRCISVNYHEEVETLSAAYPGARLASVRSVESCRFPYPLVELADLQAVAAQEADYTHVGIVNADIYVGESPFQLLSPILDDPEASLIVCRRESASFGYSSGVNYIHGFDLMLFPRDLFLSLPTSHLALGVPWWDYALPLYLLMSDRRVYLSVSSEVLHVSHPQNWSVTLWEMGLMSFIACLEQLPKERQQLRSWTDMFKSYISAPVRGHHHDAMLFTGGTLFGRTCQKMIFENAVVI